VGLLVIGVFYAADLFVMHGLPVLTSRAAAMAIMEGMHLNFSWVVILLSVGIMLTGLALILRRLLLSEERYRAFAALVSDWVYAIRVESSGEVVREWETDGFFRVSGFTRDDLDSLGGWVATVVHAEDRPILQKRVQTLRSGEADVSEYRIVTKSGAVRWLRDYARPVRPHRLSRGVRVYGAAQDITERKRAEEALRQAQKMEAVGQLTSGMAHDFNNVLTVIQANVDLVASNLPQGMEPVSTEIRETQDAARRGAALIRRLLAFTRQESLTLRLVDLAQVLDELSTALRRLLPETIEIQVAADRSLPWVYADSGAVEQIVMNLATNSRDAMPNGGVLRIGTRHESLDDRHRALHGWGLPGEYVVLSVRDTGSGVDEATRQRIFEPFFTTKPPGQGTGLGMPMVYGLTKQHRGFVDVESQVGQGTTVDVYFPISAGAPDTSQDPAQQAEEPRGGTETILLVEDEPAIRRAAKRTLEQYGYSVLLAPDGEEGLKVFRERQEEIRLVVSDVVMPRKGGAELHEEVRRIVPTAKFIFVSGYTPRNRQGSALLDPAVPRIAKPWTIRELLGVVRRTLDEGREEKPPGE
jgi:PAS domain S-box-containing protein